MLFPLLGSTHKFYTSICQAEWVDNRLECILNTFYDDLEVSIQAEQGKRFFATDDEFEKAVELYFRKHFVLKYKGKVIQAEWVGLKRNGMAVSLYFEFAKIKRDKCLLENTWLTAQFSEQSNIVQLKKAEEKKTLVFNKETTIRKF